MITVRHPESAKTIINVRQQQLTRLLRLAAGLLIVGLSAQLLTLWWNHPLAFLAFIFVASPLVLIAVAIYLYSILSNAGPEA